MKILLVNDDGIQAPGIRKLYEAVKDFGHITIVAPDGERSAIGHGITLDKPMPARQVDFAEGVIAVALNGTPADCVKLALTEIMPEKPDLVISGINLGSNTGLNVIYSGTVSGAAEAAFNGIPAIALSLTTYMNPNWSPAIKIIRSILSTIKPEELPARTVLNVNVPNTEKDSDIAGVKVTEQGMARWQEKFDKRTDPKGRTYYWMDGTKVNLQESETKDDTVIKNNYISITPIQFDLTAYSELDKIKKMNFSI